MTQLSTKLRVVALSALLSIALGACGSAASSTTTQSAQTTTRPAATAVLGESITLQPTAVTSPVASTESTIQTATKLNLNDVTEEQLMSNIPNFSDRMVREFMEYRPYVSIQQFRREIGKYVDESQVTEYEQYVYVPVDVDQADADTLQQLPGVDATIADTLIAGRPYGSNKAFLTKLASLVSAADAQQAAAYLVSQ